MGGCQSSLDRTSPPASGPASSWPRLQLRTVFLPSLTSLESPQERGKDLSSQEDKPKGLTEAAQSPHPEMPAGISRRLEDIRQSVQTEEERVTVLVLPAASLQL